MTPTKLENQAVRRDLATKVGTFMRELGFDAVDAKRGAELTRNAYLDELKTSILCVCLTREEYFYTVFAPTGDDVMLGMVRAAFEAGEVKHFCSLADAMHHLLVEDYKNAHAEQVVHKGPLH